MRNQQTGKLSNHFRGQGTVTEEMVVARAMELAQLNGRMPNQVQDSDMEQARKELTGVKSHDRMEDVPESKRWEPNPGSSGHVAEKVETDDEQTLADELVQQGAAEAEHERMVQATQRAARKDDQG